VQGWKMAASTESVLSRLACCRDGGLHMVHCVPIVSEKTAQLGQAALTGCTSRHLPAQLVDGLGTPG
jgi:hypothetical protein